jgi:hypothetical protein
MRVRSLTLNGLSGGPTIAVQSGRARRHLRGSGYRCCESSVSDRHNRAVRPGYSVNAGVEFLRERLDDARAEPGFWLGKSAVRPAYSIVGNREFPIRSVDIVRDVDLAFHALVGKCMLQSIHDQLGGDQTNTLSLTRTQTTCRPHDFQRDRSSVAKHRGREGIT